jgi:hypothetical protein
MRGDLTTGGVGRSVTKHSSDGVAQIKSQNYYKTNVWLNATGSPGLSSGMSEKMPFIWCEAIRA